MRFELAGSIVPPDDEDSVSRIEGESVSPEDSDDGAQDEET